MEIASLVVAILTLIFALFIQSETREMLGRINNITDTLPGAHDVDRVIMDRKKSKQDRAIIVSDFPKNTHIAFVPAGPPIPRAKLRKNAFWNFIRKVASYLSGDTYEPMVKQSTTGKWEVKSANFESEEIKTLFKQGWEPFSITENNMTWLRKYKAE